MNPFVGRGWSFPPVFTADGVETVTDNDEIQESLRILLSTAPGERIMRPEYGCDIRRALFDGISYSSISYLTDVIKRAILFFEPRIDVENIRITESDELNGKMNIEISYLIRGTNSRSNMVYPFYLNEGTNLAGN